MARFLQAVIVVIVACAVCGTAWAVSPPDQEEWEAARKATCQELIDAYKSTALAERKVAEALKASTTGTVAWNALGIATLAIGGFGFFSWDDNSSAEENLADLHHDLEIIKTVAAEKKCALPVQ